MSEIPDALAGFVPWLEGNGFLRTSDRFEPEAFGNRLITLERPPITVEIVSDRGVWLLGVGGQALTEGTFGAEIWRACLEGTPVPEESPDFAQQIDFIKESLSQIAAALAPDRVGDTETCLVARQREQTEAYMNYLRAGGAERRD